MDAHKQKSIFVGLTSGADSDYRRVRYRFLQQLENEHWS